MGSGCSCFLFAIKARGHHDAAVFGGARRLNLVRLRYGDVPVFLAVDSVLTQYVYAGEASLTGSVGRASGDSLSSVIGAVGATYIERPTVTYSPITGEKFAEQLLDPIQDGLVLSLVQSGWPAYEVLIMSLERLNNLQNLTFESSRPPAREELEEFEQAVRLLIELARRAAIGTKTTAPEAPNGQLNSIVFESNPDEETRALIDRFKALLGLDPERSEFRVTHDIVGRRPDQITIRVRSLLALMGFLAQGVEAPAIHLEQGLTGGAYPLDVALRSSLVPLHVQVAEQRPKDSFVAVPYAGHWFSIAHQDHASKQAFSLLNYLFQLKAPRLPTVGPMVTVPTG